MSKINVGIIYGGKSTEHEVSIRSAKSVFEALNKEKYTVTLINITKTGEWLLAKDSQEIVSLNESNSEKLSVVPSIGLTAGGEVIELDAVLPILHGTAGEDGSIQGLLELADIPYAGCSIRSSAVCMDKDMTKRLLQLSGIDVAPSLVVNYYDKDALKYEAAKEKLGIPMFVKPVNQGSSVGVSKVADEDSFYEAVDSAFSFDTKVMIESGIEGREIEVSVIGNEELFVSVPGEIVSQTDFYSYSSKYLDENGALLNIPAQLEDETFEKIRQIARKTFKVLDCEGMARVDVFLTADEKVIVNEVNTLPGFTSISMYPKLLEASGMPYTEVLDKLIELSLERYERSERLKTDIS
ncbi:D-alanine-D-alanine ligase [Jeotgalicoccus aerolatus]|uniref:D-alanine--D-alanine ligase n=1 Tax=Jeotgalicoccus aerolatus TaxID=709510 RepID=A0A1G8YT84_9STAP|nr:D-alanine--D-alanine ligase family protein [Jeotgalicoccus aerolatus]SDK05295.1 D-alanine-D-alanine ligase [Jeotgalicoccus aerolatus]HJG33884.1 D-alanine--D-alanine ligase [Jeotgalicoccus aerolatus]